MYADIDNQERLSLMDMTIAEALVIEHCIQQQLKRIEEESAKPMSDMAREILMVEKSIIDKFNEHLSSVLAEAKRFEADDSQKMSEFVRLNNRTYVLEDTTLSVHSLKDDRPYGNISVRLQHRLSPMVFRKKYRI